jgi:hypothetical protein
MTWSIEYFEKKDGEQPAEMFEDRLEASGNRDEARISGKLARVADEVAENGFRTGGGYAESCHEAPGIWQMKADVGRKRGREFFAFDNDKVVLLSGVVKGPRQPTPTGAFMEALAHLAEYKKTGTLSPEEIEDEQV